MEIIGKNIIDVLRKRERREEARKFVAEHLKDKRCVDCGEDDPVVLEFHHVLFPKLSSIARLISNGAKVEIILTEIKKCVILCCNCHRRRHNILRG